MLRIAIVACTGGAGHLRAAEALASTARQRRPEADVVSWDVLSFTPPWFRTLYARSYLEAVNRAPELWGFLYEHSERHPHRNPALVRAFDRVNYDAYWRALQKFQPDVVVCTHFLPYLAIATRLARERRPPLIAAVTTDFDVHRLWIDPVVNRYYVFHEESRFLLAAKGIDQRQITVSGIPVMPEFASRSRTATARRRLGLDPQRPTALVVVGGFGMGKIVDVARAAADALGSIRGQKSNLIVVCGRNESALNQVRRLPPKPNVDLRALGFVNNMHEWMDAADLLVSKSGGLTSSEALAKGLPMLIVDPIPGQESRNADLIVEHRAGWKASSLDHLHYKLLQVFGDPGVLRQTARRARQLGRPQAAEAILNDIVRRLRTHRTLR
jgi:processive 1,2-diacylglycerol beta-glucosyltransferase